MLLVLLAALACIAESFQWNWREAQELKADQSLRNAAITKEERQSLAKAIADRLRPDMADLEITSEKQLQEFALNTRIKKTDLNGDGYPEVIAQGMSGCSPTGNCPFWVFQRMTHGYKLLLDGFGQTFTVQHNRANGYKDIVVAMHGSAFDSGLTLYCVASVAQHNEKIR